MKFLVASALGLLSSISVYCQEPAFIKEKWSDKPALHTIDAKLNSESAVILLDKRRIEFIDEKPGDVSVYRTLHRIVRVNDDHGIESFNKVYLGVSDNSEIA